MKLFVYGTLKYPEIVRALTGKKYTAKDAFLNKHKVVALKNKPYPGLVVSDKSNAFGKLIEVDEQSFKIISEWEDTEYSLKDVTILTEGYKVRAKTFLHTVKTEQLPKSWDEEKFININLQDYIVNRIPKFLSK